MGAVGARRAGRRRRAARPDARDALGVPLRLHLHKNTIQYRIRRAEEARGRPLQDDRLDVEVALLACRLLGSTVLRPVPVPDR
ncbi:MAG: helix-turn-helix domain-containing protein [Pseudonocardia sp.]|nr:helix-turn-helix domain-containing protein [Pseudonocardia sp.]